MEDCAYMQELISRMLDEDLNADEQAALAKHLESCPACRTMYEAFAAVSASLGGELERKLTREAVRKGLAALPEEQREILLLREIRGLSYEEIGEILSLEPGTVKSRIFRARKKLCAFLLREGNIPDGCASNSAKGG